jgi:hypothetical protein
MSHRRRQAQRDAREKSGGYVLIVRGPDGRPRLERFDDANAYRARLVALESSPCAGVSIEEIVGLLEA